MVIKKDHNDCSNNHYDHKVNIYNMSLIDLYYHMLEQNSNFFGKIFQKLFTKKYKEVKTYGK